MFGFDPINQRIAEDRIQASIMGDEKRHMHTLCVLKERYKNELAGFTVTYAPFPLGLMIIFSEGLGKSVQVSLGPNIANINSDLEQGIEYLNRRINMEDD